MTASTAQRYRVALQGFSAFERQTLSSFFRLADERTPSYVQVDRLDVCDFVIADADQPASLDAVQQAGRTARAVFVGARAPEGAMALLPRPIDPMHILREFDAFIALRDGPVAASSVAPPPAPASEPTLPSFAGDDWGTQTFDAIPNGSGLDVLVTEDSAIARRFLQTRLQQCGYRVHVAANGESALALLRDQTFAIVFLDIVLGPPDSISGLDICKRLKQHPHFAGRAPKVVIVTGLSAEIDKARGALAGCDAYITKPVAEAELLAGLQRLDRGFAERNPAPAGQR